jgi:hypothetical protein
MNRAIEPLCTDCAHFPEPRPDAEGSAPDRSAGGELGQRFYGSRIGRFVRVAYAPLCPEFEEVLADERREG